MRDPRTGPGLLMIEGRQHRFCVESAWKSAAPPAPGLSVDVTFDHAGQILAITAVSESQLAQEQVEQSIAASKTLGVKILRKIAAKCGRPNLFQS
ncbi:MAG: hypothetical protein LAO30_00785 [Acidobacteriia bacterium]|nr:hypothetical protein [Terriglobia bacterium]